MERKELSFDDGLVQFSINGGKAVVVFNPADSAFVERLYLAFDALDKKQDAMKMDADKLVGNREVFEIARKRDAEMREIIDGVFGPISAELFGEMNVYAMAGGLPVWCNFLLAVMDEIDANMAAQQKLTNPRVAKYTAKYRK